MFINSQLGNRKWLTEPADSVDGLYHGLEIRVFFLADLWKGTPASQTGKHFQLFEVGLFNETPVNRSTHFKEHSQGSNPPSFINSIIQTLEVIWVITVDLHLNGSTN